VVRDEVAELEAALDRLGAVDPHSLGDGETVQALMRCEARLGALATRSVASFDTGRSWEADGARTASAWLARRCHLASSSARRRVRLGRVLRHLPVAEAAWLAGEVGEAQVAALARCRTPATEEAMAEDEEALVGEAKRLGFESFLRKLAYWNQYHDPDGTEKDAKEGRDARRLHLSQSWAGMWFGDLVLDPLDGAALATVLGRIEGELFANDWAEARSRLGEAATTADLARTPAQRRADALVEMARRAGAVPPGARLPEPLFTVLVDYPTLAGRMCELTGGSVCTPGSLVPWLDQAWVERVVFDGPDRVKNVGPRRRLFAGATRRAVEVRDRECYSEFCEVGAGECEIDHVVPYAHGGLTVDTNGRPACRCHNRNRPPP
jgi:hypothetical protein